MINQIVRSSYLQGDIFRPAFKLLDPFIIASGLGSLASGLFGSKSQASANKTNLQIAQMNNEAMLQAQRENNEWNRETAIDMFNRENAYNDPSAVAERLRAAGFNPGVAMGNGANFVTSGDISTPQSQAVPSFQQAQVSPVPSPLVGVFDGIEKYASAMSQLAQAKKHDVDAKIALDKLQPEIDEIFSRVNSNNAQAAYQNCQKALSELKAPFEVRLMISNAILNAAKGNESMANTEWKKAERQLTNTKNKQLKLQLPYIQEQAQQAINLLVEQQRTERSKQTEHYASAEQKRAQTETENVMRNFKVLESNAQINHLTEIARQAHVSGDSQVLENYLRFRGLDGKNAMELAMRILANKDKMSNDKEWLEYLRENGVIK